MSASDTSSREIRELPAGETRLAYPAMRALRTRLTDEREFIAGVDGVLRAGGYRLVGAFRPGQEEAVAVAGFRVADSLAWGHYLYIDDLSTTWEPAGMRLRFTLPSGCYATVLLREVMKASVDAGDEEDRARG